MISSDFPANGGMAEHKMKSRHEVTLSSLLSTGERGCGFCRAQACRVYSRDMRQGGASRRTSRKARVRGLRDANPRGPRSGGRVTEGNSPAEELAPEGLSPIVAPEVAGRFWAVTIICATACVSLGIAQFVGAQSTYLGFFPSRLANPDWILGFKAWWVMWTIVGFLIVPAIVMLCWPGKHFRYCNLSWRGFREHFWIYVGLYAAVFPVIFLVSWSPEFYSFYPMYPQAGRSWTDLLLWEGLYAGQFIALEFFFRGFLVGGLGRYLGVLSVPISVMPYMMIHFSKPWPEAYAAIVAGVVLGWLAWKTKSIWGGVCIHCAVAMSMDLMALSHKGQLPWLHP
jgi:membrane protease YdiL (CAAX protease family)